MPSDPNPPHTIDREQVRMLAMAVGVAQAARQLGLSEVRVRQWSSRGKWFKQTPPPPLPPTVQRERGITPVTVVTTPVEALKRFNSDTRFGLAKAASKAAKTFSRKSGDDIIAKAKALRDVTAAASTLHGWDEGKTPGVQLNIALAVKGMH